MVNTILFSQKKYKNNLKNANHLDLFVLNFLLFFMKGWENGYLLMSSFVMGTFKGLSFNGYAISNQTIEAQSMQ